MAHCNHNHSHSLQIQTHTHTERAQRNWKPSKSKDFVENSTMCHLHARISISISTHLRQYVRSCRDSNYQSNDGMLSYSIIERHVVLNIFLVAFVFFSLSILLFFSLSFSPILLSNSLFTAIENCLAHTRTSILSKQLCVHNSFNREQVSVSQFFCKRARSA